eukprot:4019716-Pleurochrysis_carterae.AAC.3
MHTGVALGFADCALRHRYMAPEFCAHTSRASCAAHALCCSARPRLRFSPRLHCSSSARTLARTAHRGHAARSGRARPRLPPAP